MIETIETTTQYDFFDFLRMDEISEISSDQIWTNENSSEKHSGITSDSLPNSFITQDKDKRITL